MTAPKRQNVSGKAAEIIARIYAAHGAGCCWHVVLDDYNWEALWRMSAREASVLDLEIDEPGSGVFRTPTRIGSNTLQSVPWSLHPIDKEDLRWFFAGGALVAIEESTFARQLERAALLGRSFRPCKKCGGCAEPWRNGTGFVPLARGVSYRQALRSYQKRAAKEAGLVVATGFAADKLRALGVEVTAQSRIDELFPELPPLLCRPCPNCDGVGIVDRALRRRGPITAFPTGSSKHGSEGPSVTLDETALRRHGRVSRLLKAVRARRHVAPDVLQSYLEPNGSYRAVWIYTAAGERMLRANKTEGMRPEGVFSNLVALEQQSHDYQLKAELDAAQRQAIEEVKEAGRVWNRVVRRELLDGAVRGLFGAEAQTLARRWLLDGGGKLSSTARTQIMRAVREEQARRSGRKLESERAE